jgi:hypothetical protein
MHIYLGLFLVISSQTDRVLGHFLTDILPSIISIKKMLLIIDIRSFLDSMHTTSPENISGVTVCLGITVLPLEITVATLIQKFQQKK